MDWTDLLQRLLEAALTVAVPLVVLALSKLASAALSNAKVAAEKHQLGQWSEIAEAAIEYAQKRLADRTGPERMAWVRGYLAQRGVEYDEVQAQAIYNSLSRYWKASADAPAAPVAEEFAAPVTEVPADA